MEATDEHMGTLRALGNGECLFRDLDGRTGRIDVDLVSDELLERPGANPTGAGAAVGAPDQ